MRAILSAAAALAIVCTTAAASAATLCVTSWNLESGDSTQDGIDSIVLRHPDCDLWALSEVAGPSVLAGIKDTVQGKTHRKMDWVISNTSRTGPDGQADFQGIVFDRGKLELERIEEVYYLKLGAGRAPLIGHFRYKSTGQAFSLMVNHLHRGSASKRLIQAKAIAETARNTTVPWIALGDYNADWTLKTKKGNSAFDALTRVWRWVQPTPLVGTTCYVSGGVVAPGILDLVLLGGSAHDWPATSEVLEKPAEYCPDGSTKPDHLPVRALITLP